MITMDGAEIHPVLDAAIIAKVDAAVLQGIQGSTHIRRLFSVRGSLVCVRDGGFEVRCFCRQVVVEGAGYCCLNCRAEILVEWPPMEGWGEEDDTPIRTKDNGSSR